MNTSHISSRFITFANKECKGSSDSYEFLALKVAEDDELLRLCTHVPSGQPVPNLLFGAVHYLLLKGERHPLKGYYPTFTKTPNKVDKEMFGLFKDFCSIYYDSIISIFQEKLVQTNEVRRCAYLYPIFSYIYRQVQRPLSLIEIGTSAGLQLLWDKYSYAYGTDKVYGDKHSDVHLRTAIKGENMPILKATPPPVASRIGVDLHISDVSDEDDYVWLKALIWPEHKERLDLFERAVACFKRHSVELIEGDGVALLPDIVANLPSDTAICIFHTHVANQMPVKVKENLLTQVKQIGQKRNVFHVYNNIWDRNLHLDSMMNGVETEQTIGQTDGHGKWFEWNIE